jgi:hypothetical protein
LIVRITATVELKLPPRFVHIGRAKTLGGKERVVASPGLDGAFPGLRQTQEEKSMALRSRLLCYSFVALSVAVVGMNSGTLCAGTITYTLPSVAINPVSGQPVSETATFTTSTDQIVVIVNNPLVNPTDVSENLSDLFFTISSGQNSGTINQALSSGTSRTVAADGTFTDAGTVSPTHWALQTSGSHLLLNDLTGGQPKQTIIGSPNGSDIYSNANGSIAGNGPHNPFLFGPVTFTLSVPGVTDASTITAATFSFGTVAGENVAGVAGVVPEPASATLIAIGWTSVLALAALRRRARRCTP